MHEVSLIKSENPYCMGSFSYCVTVGDVGLVWATPEGKRLLHHQKIAIRQQHYHFFFFFF